VTPFCATSTENSPNHQARYLNPLLLTLPRLAMEPYQLVRPLPSRQRDTFDSVAAHDVHSLEVAATLDGAEGVAGCRRPRTPDSLSSDIECLTDSLRLWSAQGSAKRARRVSWPPPPPPTPRSRSPARCACNVDEPLDLLRDPSFSDRSYSCESPTMKRKLRPGDPPHLETALNRLNIRSRVEQPVPQKGTPPLGVFSLPSPPRMAMPPRCLVEAPGCFVKAHAGAT